jgi:hypothetical protein
MPPGRKKSSQQSMLIGMGPSKWTFAREYRYIRTKRDTQIAFQCLRVDTDQSSTTS